MGADAVEALGEILRGLVIHLELDDADVPAARPGRGHLAFVEGQDGRVLVPKPVPVRCSTRAPVGWAAPWHRCRRIAAPVGVIRSPWMPSSIIANPSRRSAVAGAGTGSGPCCVRTRPPPSGSAETVQAVGFRAAARWAAATMSAIESQAPTSWKATSSTGMP